MFGMCKGFSEEYSVELLCDGCVRGCVKGCNRIVCSVTCWVAVCRYRGESCEGLCEARGCVSEPRFKRAT